MNVHPISHSIAYVDCTKSGGSKKQKKKKKTNQWLKTDMGCEHNRKVQVLFLVKGKS